MQGQVAVDAARVARGPRIAPLTCLILSLLVGFCSAQAVAPSEKLDLSARSAFTWSRAGATIIQLEGDVRIELDRATMTADQAVVWLTPTSGGAPGEQRAEFELIGHTEIHQEIATVSGDHRYVTAEVVGDVRTSAPQRVARDMSGSALYHRAETLRRDAATRPTTSVAPLTTRPATGPGAGRTRTERAPAAPAFPVHLEAARTDAVDTEEGTVAIVAWGGVVIEVKQPTGESIVMRSQRAVLFTSMTSLRDTQTQDKTREAGKRVTAVYLEGDARIEYVMVKGLAGEQRLRAERVYYELADDRAILIDAVLHTVLPQQQIPVIVRAKIIRQLSKEEFDNKNVQITSSGFAVPSYSIGADRLYVQAEATGDPDYPERVNYEAHDATFQAFDVPFFYFPYTAGSIGDRPGPLRGIGFMHQTDMGYSFLSDWGLFESLGQIPPRSIDAGYRLDYFEKRGPGFGLDAAYGGGFLTEPEHDPWNFEGDLKSYFVYDKGTDEDYGRLPVKPDGPGYDLRGRVVYEHQHFFPDDWQAQIRLGYLSDPTFMEEWFPREFDQQGPIDTSAYIKRERDDETFTLLVEAQPNRLITSSDSMPDQFEVEHLPEVGYHREGDSVLNDSMTFFTDDSVAGLHFQPTKATLAQQGFLAPTVVPGIPALGQTGLTSAITWRADFRQEIDWPLDMDHFKVVPYLVGRYTEYSDSPEGDPQARFFGAAGARVTTTFWKTDPTMESDLLDIHQMRHVIEPELNVFTSGSTVDRSRLYMYDTPIDAINDVSAVDLALRQRWQTQRGGPDRWRSVDVFTLDIDAEFYANKPNRATFLNPYDFRGVFFSSLPETSVPRDAVNADATWRISDNTVVLGDASYNLDERKLATAAVGVLVVRDVQESLYLGNRYIADLDSNIVSVQMSYRISPKYTLSFGQDFDFGLGKDVSSNIAIVRFFDRFLMVFSFGHDEIGNQTNFNFAIAPLGLGTAFSSSAVQGPFQR